MSEYQYYEFQAVDRPLNAREMDELRALSTRAAITPTRFVNTYNYGSFRGDPAALMETYFDAFVYVANWGTREFMLRLPQRLLSLETANLYCVGELARARATGDHVIVEFRSEDEPEDDEDGEDWMPTLLPLRAELAAGDVRSLYLGWLVCAQDGLLDDEEPGPLPPPGLSELSASLQALADFLRLGDDLIAVAAEGSPLLKESAASRDALGQWIAGLTTAEKDALLLRLVGQGDPHLQAELRQRFRRETTTTRDEEGADEAPRRTVGELLATAERRTARRQRAEAERAARERERQEREQAAARARYLDGLAGREADLWGQVDALIATKRPADYDRAVGLLADLHDLHARARRAPEFEARRDRLREEHARKPSLLQRFDRAGL